MQTLVNRKKGFWEVHSLQPDRLKANWKAGLVQKRTHQIRANWFFYSCLDVFLLPGIRSIVMYCRSASGTTIDPSPC